MHLAWGKGLSVLALDDHRPLHRQCRRERMSMAGGQLLSAAVTWLGEVFQAAGSKGPSHQVEQDIQARLGDCLDRDDKGRPRLKFTLPDDAMTALAKTLASILTRAT